MTGHFLTHAVALMAAAVFRGLTNAGPDRPATYTHNQVIADAQRFLKFMNGGDDAK